MFDLRHFHNHGHVYLTLNMLLSVKEIGDVQHLTANKSTDKITLSWEAPAKYPTCVVKYSITQCLKECNNTEVGGTEYVANNLEPCKQYSFIVKTVSYEVESNGINVKGKINSPSKLLSNNNYLFRT